jgi:hypothetical protein
MSDTWTIRLTLFLAGFVPCALLGGLSEYGDNHALPWLVGFSTQAGVVFGFIAQRRGWWRR